MMRTKLLVHFCPYCGARDLQELDFITDEKEVEHCICSCLTCDETFSVSRELVDEEDENEGEKK